MEVDGKDGNKKVNTKKLIKELADFNLDKPKGPAAKEAIDNKANRLNPNHPLYNVSIK